MSPLPSNIDDLLAHVNRAHGTSLRVAGRYAGGEQGAAALIDADGRRYALKLYSAGQLPQLRAAQAITERLRGAGYPAPAYRYIGTAGERAYSVQTALPGAPARALTAALARELCALNAIQAGRALAATPPWPAPAVEPMLHGGPGFCLLAPMRAYSPETAELLETTQAIARAAAGVALPQRDIVHFDWTPANILIADGRVSGVIDWDGPCAGDRAFDLATMLFYSDDSPGALPTLWAALKELAAPQTIRLYLAHLAHRQVDWSIRHHGPAAVTRWMAVARALLSV